MSEHIHRSHNVSVLLYHIVCPAKYQRVVVSAEVDKLLRDVCLEIAARYEITFLEIGTDRNHVHFLVQTIPSHEKRYRTACRGYARSALWTAQCHCGWNIGGASKAEEPSGRYRDTLLGLAPIDEGETRQGRTSAR